MDQLVKSVVQAIELYYGLVSMISMGNFAAAAVAAATLRMLLVSLQAMLRAMAKKKTIKKTRKKSKRKGRKQCSCGGLDNVRRSKPKELCLELVSLEFGAERSENYLEIWRDEKGKEPKKIDKLVWEYQNTENENDKNRMGYVSGAKMKSKAKFRITQKPEKWEQKWVTITGKVSIPGKERLFTFTDFAKVTKNDEVITDLMLANKHLNEHLEEEKPQTQFFDPMTIEWRVRYTSPGSLPETKVISVSEHKVYVTYGDYSKSEELEKVYLSLLHWAVSNDGATNPKQVVWKTWQHFANRNLTTWSGEKLFYYPHKRPDDLKDGLEACLAHQSGYTECTEFSDLLSQALLVNNISHNIVAIELENKGRMMVKNWVVKTPVSFPGKDYPLKLTLFKTGTTAKLGSMVSLITKKTTTMYGDLINIPGLAGQNVLTPTQKVFESHQILHLPSSDILPSELLDDESGLPTPYLDPSYGVTYINKEDFIQDALFGYVLFDDDPESVDDKEGQSRFIFKAKKADSSDNLIKFGHSPVN